MTRLSRLFTAAAVALFALCGFTLQAQDWAKPMLEKSSRHREYVPVTSNGRTINTFVVYPEVKGKAPVVVLIHEIFGLSDWLKAQADEIAAQGYIVVVPDLTTGTDALFASGGQEAVVKGVTSLPDDQVMADLDAVSDYGKKLPAANGKLFVAGFCWGGGKSFAFATHRMDLSAAFVFYGPPPAAADMAKINVPVYGFYGENDARIGATVPQAITDMKAAGKVFEPVTYAGAGHGFMRGGQDPAAKPGDKKAFDKGFARLVKLLKSNSMGGKKMAAVAKSKGSHHSVAAMDCSAMHGAV